MKNELSRPFTIQEAEQALFSTNSNKAPGPDGMNAGVLKSLWHVIHRDFMDFLDKFHSRGHISPGLSSFFIALIPKTLYPSSPGDFRPISLMNASIKLLTKILALRLGKVMNFLVSETQSTFIRKRQISDCILLTSAVYAALKSGKSRGFIVKLDFAKVFDTMNWDFAYQVLQWMNLGNTWVRWIKNIFESSRISVLVNGSPTEEFQPLRGIR